MTTVFRSPTPQLQFLNNCGQPDVGGSLLTQVGGVNYATYQDAAGTIALPNPIPLNSRGEISNSAGASCELFLVSGVTYTFTLYDSAGNQIGVYPNVTGSIDQASLALATGSALVGFLQAGTGAVARTEQSKGRDEVCISDYGADPAASAATNTAAILAAIAALPAAGGEITATPGVYDFSAEIDFSKSLVFRCKGAGGVIPSQTGSVTFRATAAVTGRGMKITARNVELQNLILDMGNHGTDGLVVLATAARLIRPTVYNAVQDGIRVGSDSGGPEGDFSSAFYMEQPYASNCGRRGIYISNANVAAPPNGGTIIAPRVVSAGENGIVLEKVQHTDIFNPLVENCFGYGVSLMASANNNRLFGGDLDEQQNAAKAILINAAAYDNSIFGTACAIGLNATVPPVAARTYISVSNNGVANHGQFRNYVPWYVMDMTGNVGSGTYTPTLTNGANVALSTAFDAQWMRVGDSVTVSGQVQIDPIVNVPTFTVLGMSLPVASNFAQTYQCGGTFNASTIEEGGNISADIINKIASFNFMANNASNTQFQFFFMYKVI